MQKLFLQTALSGILITLAWLSAMAATPAQYRERVERNLEHLERLENIYDEWDYSLGDIAPGQRAIVEKIKETLPAGERIEAPGHSVEVDNRWLHEGLDEALKEKPESADYTQRLDRLTERLESLLVKLNELERAAGSDRSKDEEKRKLDEILSREEYKKPEEKEESPLEKAWREFTEWLSKLFPERKPGPSTSFEGLGSLSTIIQGLVLALAIGIVAFLLYKFSPFLRSRFGRRDKKEKETRVILGEILQADETSHDLFAEAEKLAGQGNLRGAIRKGYIALLCELSDRKIIGLARHKTNRDYLRDLRKREEIFGGVKSMTGSFERHWYGFADADTADWDEFRQSYRQTLNKPNAAMRNE